MQLCFIPVMYKLWRSAEVIYEMLLYIIMKMMKLQLFNLHKIPRERLEI